MTESPAPAVHPTIDDIVGEMDYLSPAPRVLPQLERLLTNPNSSLFEIVELVRLDAALTGGVIRMSNSVSFGRGAPCQTLGEAVNRVGFRHVQRLVVTAAAATLVQRLEVYGLSANTGWEESVACALAAEMLAARVGEDLPAAYLIGLMHGVGRLAINHFLAGGRDPGLRHEGFPGDYSADEADRTGATQAEVGAMMMQRWEFRPAMVEPIRWQYQPRNAPPGCLRLSAVLHGARYLRSVICAGAATERLRADPAVLVSIKTTESELLGLLPDLHERLYQARQLTELH